MRKIPSVIFVSMVLLNSPTWSALLSNTSFEIVPNFSSGQGLLPSEWINAGNITPPADTWSNDGSYGAAPGEYNHFFTPFSANDGIRWVAGAEYLDLPGNEREAVAQQLATPLSAGERYLFTSYVSHTTLVDGVTANPGGWEVLLSPTATFEDTNAISLGNLAETNQLDTWESRTLSFIAPSNSSVLTFLILAPYSSVPDSRAYVGIDNVSLTMVPIPSASFLFASALLGWLGLSTKKRNKEHMELFA